MWDFNNPQRAGVWWKPGGWRTRAAPEPACWNHQLHRGHSSGPKAITSGTFLWPQSYYIGDIPL